MGRRPHAPSQLRAFLRRLKEHRGALDPLLDVANGIEEPATRAAALAAVAAHPDAAGTLRQQAVSSLEKSLGEIDREGQVAETVPAVLKQSSDVLEPAELRKMLHHLLDLPDGEALSEGIQAAARYVPAQLQSALFDRAIQNRGQEREDAKAVLRAAFGRPDALLQTDAWREQVARLGDTDLRIRLAAFLHHQVSAIEPGHPGAEAAWSDATTGLEDTLGTGGPRERADLWRTVARDAAGADQIRAVIEVATKEPPVVQADALMTLGAQADRCGDPRLAGSAFEAAEEALKQVTGRDQDRLSRKLETARRRLAGVAGASPSPPPKGPKGSPDDLLPRTGHALALCNTYTGGVKAAHFRAVARAAPLAAAFGLDLVLLGFPVALDDLVARTARETRIGGRPWIVQLYETDRVHEAPRDPTDGRSLRERYIWVATSERASEERQVSLEGLVREGPVCMVMGIGPKGLPDRVLRACRGEYEITGGGIGLETATAMGILADRLARAARSGKGLEKTEEKKG